MLAVQNYRVPARYRVRSLRGDGYVRLETVMVLLREALSGRGASRSSGAWIKK